MKILLIQDSLSDKGGAEKAVFQIKELLEKKGNEVELVGNYSKEETLFSFFSRFYSFKYYYLTKKKIKQFKPDIIHIHNYSHFISPSPILAAKKLKKKIILTVHDFTLYCPKVWGVYKDNKICSYGLSVRCLYSNCKTRKQGYIYFPYQWLKILKVYFHKKIIEKNIMTISCASTTLCTYIKKVFPKKNILYIPNFINFEDCNNLFLKREYFTYIGRLEKEKGIEVLLYAFKRVLKEKPNEKLQIIGEGSQKSFLIKKTIELGINSNVIFRGQISNYKINKFYLNSKAIIIPSILMENITQVGIEAIKNKTFIIASNIGGIPDLINNNGILFKPGDYISLSNIMLDESKFKNNYDNEKFKNLFSDESQYKTLINLYKNEIYS